jgi:hypothetical protein
MESCFKHLIVGWVEIVQLRGLSIVFDRKHDFGEDPLVYGNVRSNVKMKIGL